MNIIINIIRFAVGVLFIFSGLVKAIDPLGLSYKMDEFFGKWNWNWASSFSLGIAIAMIAAEIFAGMSLLLGWKPKFITRFLLLLIVFFTFLTGYAFLSGKFHSCGCFGDCIPITPKISFIKDIILLFFIILLCIGYKKIRSFLNKTIAFLLLTVSTLACFFLMFYVLQHLPIKDCLPYAKGKDILQQMQPPPGSIPDSVIVYFKYKKNGKEIEFDVNHFPPDFDDSTYQYIDRENKVVRKGNAKPAIVDFALKALNGYDITQVILMQKNKYILFFVRDFNESKLWWKPDFERIHELCKAKNMPLFFVSNMGEAVQNFNERYNYNCPILSCDGTVMKTFLRAKTGAVIMSGSVIEEKFNIRDIYDIINIIKN